jgi:tetratricopeptide (TPR) repeat protein
MGAAQATNPYVVGPPVSGDQLYGRQEVLQFIAESLAGVANRLIVLHGQRRVGKTSVLQELHLNYLPRENCCAVRIDVQGQAHTPCSQVVHDLAFQIADALGMPEPDPYHYQTSDKYFLDNFLPQALEKLGERRLVIMIDEFDALANGESGSGAPAPSSAGARFVPLLQTVLDNRDFERVVCILVIGRSLDKLPAAFSQFIRGARFHPIWLLSEADARRLVTQPAQDILEYAEGAIERIWHYASGHPYFTQLLCYEVFNRAKREQQARVQAEDVDQIINTALESGAPAFAWLWDALNIAERLIVSAIGWAAVETGHARREQIQAILTEHRIRLGNVDLVKAANQLVREHVLQFEGQDDYGFEVELVRLWLNKTHNLNQERLKISEMSRTASNYYNVARRSHDRGKLEAAIEGYHLALQDNSNHFKAQLDLAQALQDQGNLREAVEEFENAYWLDPNASLEGLLAARLAMAEGLEGRGQYVEAAVHYRRVYELAPRHRPLQEKLTVLYDKGEQASNRERWSEAIEFFERVADIAPDYRGAQAKLLRILYAQGCEAEKVGDWPRAAQFLRRVVDIDPHHADASERKRSAEVRALATRPVLPVSPPQPRRRFLAIAVAILAFLAVAALMVGRLGPPPRETPTGIAVKSAQAMPSSQLSLALPAATETRVEGTQKPTNDPGEIATPVFATDPAETTAPSSGPTATSTSGEPSMVVVVTTLAPTVTVTLDPAPTPTPTLYPQPQLLFPPNRDLISAAGRFSGRGSRPRLEWEPVVELGANDFYVVTLSFVRASGSISKEVAIKDSSWLVTPDLYDQLPESQRDLTWWLSVRHFTGSRTNAEGQLEPVGEGVEVSPRSGRRVFRWDVEAAPLPAGEALDVDINPHNPEELFVLMKDGSIYRTRDSGNAWQAISPVSPGLGVLEVAPQDGRTLYGGAFQRIIKSVDDGEHWRSFWLAGPLQVFDLAIAQSDSDTVYAATAGGILISQDGGVSWHAGRGPDGMDVIAPLYAVALPSGGDGPVYAAGEGDVVYHSDGASSPWQAEICRPCRQAIHALAANDKTVYAGSALAGLARSDNGGKDWVAANRGIPNRSLPSLDIAAIHLTTQGVMYAGTGFRATNANGLGLLRSIDGGGSWTYLPFPAGAGATYYVQGIATHPANSEVVYIAGFGGVHKSVDGGQTWIKQ